MLKIYLDMDGVFVDFENRWKQISKERNITSVFDYDVFYDEVVNNDLFTKLDELPGVTQFRDFFDVLNVSSKIQVEMLSSTGISKHYDEATSQKKEWLRLYGYRFKLNTTPSHTDKVKFCTDENCVLVDDRQDTIDLWNEAGGIGLWYDPERPAHSRRIIMDDILTRYKKTY